MEKRNWKQTVEQNSSDPVVIKLTKQIKINRILWSMVVLVIAIIASVLTWAAVTKEWEKPKNIIAITIPWIATAIALGLDIIIFLGNKIGVLSHNGQQIIFYSGINTNMVFVDGVLTSKGSSEEKLCCNINNGYVVNIVFKLVDFDIVIKTREELEALALARQEAFNKGHNPKVEEPKVEPTQTEQPKEETTPLEHQ